MAVKNVVIVLQIVDTDITCTTNEKLKKGEEISCMSTSIYFTDSQQSYNMEETYFQFLFTKHGQKIVWNKFIKS